MPARRTARAPRALTTSLPFLAPQLLWADWAARSTEMLMASSQVIAHRTQRMATAGHTPNARDRREFTLMGTEKIAAAQDSAMAMQKHLMAAPWQLGLKVWQDAMSLQSAAMRVGMSRTPAEAMARGTALAKAASGAGKRSARLSSSAARLASGTLEPIAKRATANAKRLGKL